MHPLDFSVSRRSALQTMLACGMSFGLNGMSARAAAKRRNERPKTVITLWMDGGMSQLETWDPKAGTKVGGDTKSIKTSQPGVEVSDFLPRMAEHMHEVCLIRSLTSREGDHERGAAFVKTGYRLDPTLVYPSLGAIAARELPDDAVEIPQHITLGEQQFFPRGGYLGNKYDAFRVLDPGNSLQNLKMHVEDERLQRRRKSFDFMAKKFHMHRPNAAESTQHAANVHRALTMMSSEQLKAFEIDKESAAVRASYGDSNFGRGCLVARRLVEVGVRSIEVSLSGFDTHANNHEGQKTQAAAFDPAFASLLQELKDRDLLDSTIVMLLTEFGRTPAINPAGGRDHFPHWFSGVVAGGGFRKGMVIGETSSEPLPQDVDRRKQKPKPKDPVTVPQLYATVLHSMGIDYSHEVDTPIGRPMKFTDGEPLMKLMDS